MEADLQNGGRDGVTRQLCRVEDIPEGVARDFRWGEGAGQRTVFVLRKGGALYAYANACPHIGTPLNWLPDRFFDRSGELLLCGTHGALFRPEDGHCLRGPCLGKRLTPMAIRVENGEIVLAE
jgi:nitrite reductase/ring-hydroxylating ferredoxin subunit